MMNCFVLTHRIGNSGFAPLLIAIGIVTVLAMMSLTSSLTMGLKNKKIVEKLNRIESFYSGELLAWHARERSKSGLEVKGNAVGFDNSYADNIDGISEGGDGVPYNLFETRKFSPGNRLIRRHVPDRFIASEGSNTSCGRVGVSGSKNYRVCLAGTKSKSGIPSLYVAYITQDGSGTGINLIGIQKNGEQDPNFGINGVAQIRGIFNTTNFTPKYIPHFVVRSDGKLLFLVQNGLFLTHGDGTIDTSYGVSGLLPVSLQINTRKSRQQILWPGFDDSTFVHEDLSDNVGFSQPHVKLHHSLKSGASDESFGTQGYRDYDLSPLDGVNETINSVASHSKGHFISVSVGSRLDGTFKILSLKTDGGIQSAFGENGIASTSGIGNFKMTVLNDGKLRFIVPASGGCESEFAQLRYNANGSPDTGFGNNGFECLSPCSLKYSNSGYYFDRDDRMLEFNMDMMSGRNAVLKYVRRNFDGSPDLDFNANGTRGIEIVGFGASNPILATDVKFAKDGSFYALLTSPAFGGTGYTGNGISNLPIMILRGLANGNPDTNFGVNGLIKFTVPAASSTSPAFQAAQ